MGRAAAALRALWGWFHIFLTRPRRRWRLLDSSGVGTGFRLGQIGLPLPACRTDILSETREMSPRQAHSPCAGAIPCRAQGRLAAMTAALPRPHKGRLGLGLVAPPRPETPQ